MIEPNKNIDNKRSNNKKMKQKGTLDKVSQIISISNNYLSHKKNLTKVRGLVDHSSPKRNIDISDYLSRKNTYRELRK